MIDTIHIRLSNLRSYPELAHTLRTYDRGVKDMVYVGNRTPQNQRFIAYHNEDGTNIVTSFRDKFVASSSYEVSYKIEYVKDCIDFNISIPKYIWGNNLRMYVTHKTHKDFDYINGASISGNLKESFRKLHEFVRMFNEKHLQAKLIDISLIRIDLCFNMFFQNKVEKNQYLYYLKSRAPRHSRNTSNNPVYRTGIYRTSKLNTLKIYDKGEEFKKNDSKKVREPEKLQKIADKILRYEVEFKASFFKKFINTQLEDYKNSPYIKKLRERVKTNDFIYWYLENKNLQMNFEPSSAYFYNSYLHQQAVNYFKKFLSSFKVESITEDTLQTKILRHNNYVRMNKVEKLHKINDRRLKQFVTDLATYGRERLIVMDIYPKATYYRNIKKLKDIGFDTPEIVAPLSFINNFNLEKYHDLFF